MQLKQLERVLYFESYIVTEPGLTPLEKYQLLTEDELLDAQDEYGEDALHRRHRRRGGQAHADGPRPRGRSARICSRSSRPPSPTLKPKKIIKRLKVVESFIDSGNRPSG